MSDYTSWEDFDRLWLDERRRHDDEADDCDRIAHGDDAGVRREAPPAPGRMAAARRDTR
jgi:hypothetical protein